MARAALATLSTEHLLHNLTVIKQQVGTTQIMATVKANAYGHGIRSVSKRLAPHVDALGVASIDEALALRQVGIKIPIILLEGVFTPDELLLASCERLSVVFHEPSQLEWLRTISLPLPINAWVKVDTGLGRLGFNEKASIDKAYEQLLHHPHILKPLGIMSHFSCADEPEHPLNQKQITQFEHITQNHVGPKSFCNSAALFAFPTQHYTLVRPGIALYGINPMIKRSVTQLDLKPVMSLQTRLLAVRSSAPGATIGYGARFTCPETMPIGVAAIGYGDGYPRTAQNGTPVLVNGIRCPLVGRVSMDMITIDLRNCPQAQVGDPVVLWGNGLALEEVAPFTGHIPYDLLTAVQSRVRFHWTSIT